MTISKSHKPRPGLVHFSSLAETWPWTINFSNTLKWVTWQTDSILGISKTALIKRVTHKALALQAETDLSADQIANRITRHLTAEAVANNAGFDYANKTKGMISSVEAQRRARFFAEDYLNKEFDVFLGLLPSQEVTAFLQQYFPDMQAGGWQVFGNGNDFEDSTGMRFMQMDTLAYQPSTCSFVPLELKIDADFNASQLLKYCFMAAHLESRKFISANSRLRILVLSAHEFSAVHLGKLVVQAKRMLAARDNLPTKELSAEAAGRLIARVGHYLDNHTLKATTWQQVGTYFDERKCAADPAGETVYKLIDGFTWSLARKYSRKKKANLYTPR